MLSDDEDFVSEKEDTVHKRKRVIIDDSDDATTDGDEAAPSLDLTLRKLMRFTGYKARSTVSVDVAEFRRLVLAEADPAVSSQHHHYFFVHH